MSPVETPDLAHGRSLLADVWDLLLLALLPLLLYLAAQRYLPTDWYSRVTTFLSFDEPIIIHAMGDGSVQEITDIGTDAKVYFAAITARGGETVSNLGGN